MFQQRSGSAVAWVQQQLAAGTFGRPLFAHALTLWHRDEAYLGWGGVPLGPELAELLGIPGDGLAIAAIRLVSTA